MSGAELVRIVRTRPGVPEAMRIEADASERAALAERVGVVSIESLVADLALDPDGPNVSARGRLSAQVTQACAVAGDPFAVTVDEPIDLLFVPEGAIAVTEEEREFDSNDPDEIEYDGESIDLGEAVAQSLALAIDPYAEGPDADRVRREAGIVDEDAPRGPLADALAALKRN